MPYIEKFYRVIGYLEGLSKSLDSIDNSTAQIEKHMVDKILIYVNELENK